MTERISIYYADVGEQGPRYGCSYHSERRQVRDVQDVEGGQKGVVCYKGKDIPVWRRSANLAWETRESALAPVKMQYL